MTRGGAPARLRLLWPVLLAPLAGCATSYNLQPVRHAVDPRAKAEPAPGFSAAAYRTFSVFPLSWVAMTAKLKNEGVEQQLLFDARNQFEALGYRFVPPEQTPDFYVTVDAAVAARLPGKPQPEGTLPLAMPHPAFIHPVPLASIIEFSSTMMERVHWLDDTAHAFRAGDWANWTDPRPQHPDSPTPLYPGPQAGTSAGSGYGAPQVWVIVVDGKSFDEVWAGTAAGATPETRLPLAGQLPVWAAVGLFPPAANRTADRVETAYGLRYQIMTNDDINYFPTVIAVGIESPAQAAGLAPGDMIISVAGHSMANIPFAAFTALLAKEPAGPFGISVWRKAQEMPCFLSSPGDLSDPAFRPARVYPVTEPPALGLGW